VKEVKRLPDSEFDVMNAIWEIQGPVNSNMVMDMLDGTKKWKIQTIISLMMRLVDKGFLTTEKKGKDRLFYPEIKREEYLKFETDNFIDKFYDNSALSLVNTLYRRKNLNDKDIEELAAWLRDRGKENE